MVLEINKLIESDIDAISKVGWFLYDIQDRNEGLTQNELEHLVNLLGFKDLDIEIEKELDEAYERGYEEGKQDCDCDCW